MYSKKVQQLFLHPHNLGELKNADGIGSVGNPRCGDIMKLWIKVDKKTEIIQDIKFKTFGCAAAIATSSMITDMAMGKKIDEALKITNLDVAEKLGGLPPVKMHCSNLAADALRGAIEDYQNKKYKKSKIRKKITKEMIVEEVIHNYPESIPVFEKYKLSCIGCNFSHIDTIEKLAKKYKLPLKQLLQELNNTGE